MASRLHLAALAVAPLVAAGLLTATAAPATAAVNWARTGPNAVTVDNATNHKIYRPKTLGAGGTKNPVVIWGNGTGATPAAYDGLLRHFASHGFIVAAAKTKQSNNGLQMRAGIDVLKRRNNNWTSPYYKKVDLGNIAAAGHSQGGAGALVAAEDDTRVDAVLPIQPGPFASPGAVTQPTLYMAGQYDNIVWPWWVRGDYNVSDNRPAAYAEIRYAGHFEPAGDGGKFRGMATAWLYLTLRGSADAKAMFGDPTCAYCSNTTLLSDFERNAEFVPFAS